LTGKMHRGDLPKQRSSAQHRGRGLLFVISAPSGAGKTTLCSTIRSEFPDLLYSVSYTTRKPRSGEREGVDYHFIKTEEFRQRIREGRWAEWAEVYGNLYGTSADFIDANLSAGSDILLDIDVQGTLQILQHYPQAVTIFILPPDLDTLRRRLEGRGTEGAEEMAARLADAKAEIARSDIYRHVIVNDRLAEAQHDLKTLIARYRSEGARPA